MFGFLVGTASLIGLIKVLRHGRCGYGYAGYGGGGCGGGRWGGGWHHGHHGRGHGRWGGGGYGGRWFLRRILERLDTTPGQEKVIFAAMEEVQKAASKFREEKEKSRADIARAMRAEHFDQAAVKDMFARHDAVMEELRKTVNAELAKVHEALDERQRKEVANLLEHGWWSGRGRGGWGGGWARWNRGGNDNDNPGQYV